VRLTTQGNVALADGAELIAVLDTDDERHPVVDGRRTRIRSTVELSGVDETYRLALAAGFARRYKRRVVPVKKRRGVLADEPLEAWRLATEALLERGVLSTAGPQAPTLAAWFDDAVVDLLLSSWAVDRPVALPAVAAAFADELAQDPGLAELADPAELAPLDEEAVHHLAGLVERLALAGLVALEVPNPAGDAPRRLTGRRLAGATVESTSLARWFLRPIAQQDGFTVAAQPDPADADADRGGPR
jgi:hypothetical protein